LKAAFADTSAVLAALFGEPDSVAMRRAFGSLDKLYATNLLEAEVRSVGVREHVDASAVKTALSHLEWVFPDRPLSREFEIILGFGILRGADLWHLACALYVAEDPRNLPFITLDQNQARLAKALGFQTSS